jgi:DNA-directed RNA polymerase specialized sigma subunit
MAAQKNEVNLLATWAGAELRRDVNDRDDYIIGRALQSVEGLLHKIARHYRGTEDSLQEARIATLEAFLTYDASKGAFSTHCFQKARKAIQNERGISGSKTYKSTKQKGQEGSISLDMPKDSQNEDKALSLHDKLADPNNGEHYQSNRIDLPKVRAMALEFVSTLKKEANRQLFTAILIEGQPAGEYAAQVGLSKQAVSMAQQKLLAKFVAYCQD